MEDYVEEEGVMKEAKYAHDKMMTETCDCSIKQISGFSFVVVFLLIHIYSRSEERFQYLQCQGQTDQEPIADC